MPRLRPALVVALPGMGAEHLLRRIERANGLPVCISRGHGGTDASAAGTIASLVTPAEGAAMLDATSGASTESSACAREADPSRIVLVLANPWTSLWRGVSQRLAADETRLHRPTEPAAGRAPSARAPSAAANDAARVARGLAGEYAHGFARYAALTRAVAAAGVGGKGGSAPARQLHAVRMEVACGRAAGSGGPHGGGGVGRSPSAQPANETPAATPAGAAPPQPLGTDLASVRAREAAAEAADSLGGLLAFLAVPQDRLADACSGLPAREVGPAGWSTPLTAAGRARARAGAEAAAKAARGVGSGGRLTRRDNDTHATIAAGAEAGSAPPRCEQSAEARAPRGQEDELESLAACTPPNRTAEAEGGASAEAAAVRNGWAVTPVHARCAAWALVRAQAAAWGYAPPAALDPSSACAHAAAMGGAATRPPSVSRDELAAAVAAQRPPPADALALARAALRRREEWLLARSLGGGAGGDGPPHTRGPSAETRAGAGALPSAEPRAADGDRRTAEPADAALGPESRAVRDGTESLASMLEAARSYAAGGVLHLLFVAGPSATEGPAPAGSAAPDAPQPDSARGPAGARAADTLVRSAEAWVSALRARGETAAAVGALASETLGRLRAAGVPSFLVPALGGASSTTPGAGAAGVAAAEAARVLTAVGWLLRAGGFELLVAGGEGACAELAAHSQRAAGAAGPDEGWALPLSWHALVDAAARGPRSAGGTGGARHGDLSSAASQGAGGSAEEAEVELLEPACGAERGSAAAPDGECSAKRLWLRARPTPSAIATMLAAAEALERLPFAPPAGQSAQPNAPVAEEASGSPARSSAHCPVVSAAAALVAAASAAQCGDTGPEFRSAGAICNVYAALRRAAAARPPPQPSSEPRASALPAAAVCASTALHARAACVHAGSARPGLQAFPLPGLEGAVRSRASGGRGGEADARAALRRASGGALAPPPSPRAPRAAAPPALTVAVTTRVDNHSGDATQRQQAQLDSLGSGAARLGMRIELLIVEWNRLPGAPPVASVLRASRWRPWLRVRVLVVPPAAHAAAAGDASVAARQPVLQYIAKNVAIRRAAAPWVLATNSDLVFSRAFFDWLARAAPLDARGVFWRADRVSLGPTAEGMRWDSAGAEAERGGARSPTRHGERSAGERAGAAGGKGAPASQLVRTGPDRRGASADDPDAPALAPPARASTADGGSTPACDTVAASAVLSTALECDGWLAAHVASVYSAVGVLRLRPDAPPEHGAAALRPEPPQQLDPVRPSARAYVSLARAGRWRAAFADACCAARACALAFKSCRARAASAARHAAAHAARLGSERELLLSPAALHMCAPGDFLLMPAAAWRAVGAYAELPFQNELDKLPLVQAHVLGWRQRLVPEAAMVLHQYHPDSMDGGRLSSGDVRERPYLRPAEFDDVARRMLARGTPWPCDDGGTYGGRLRLCRTNRTLRWGLAGEHLETQVPSK